ncbi:MAG: 50S ribosomal protein L25 [Verrucomicrobiota bacterium]
MAKQVQLKAKLRNVAGKTKVKRLRAQGSVPGSVYGAHTKPYNITVNTRELGDVLHSATGENVLVDLQVDDSGKTDNRLALIQEVQHHPFLDTILHVDFHELLATEKFHTKVPVRPSGEPVGVKTGGGVLEYVMRELHVECLPKDLPELLEVNVEKLEIGQSIHVKDVVPPAGVTLTDDKDMTIFLIVAPIAEEVAATTEAASGEPEVIGAKKEEGAEGAAEGEAAAGKAEAKPAAGKAAAEAKPAAGKAEAKPAAGKAEAKPAAGKK